MKKVFSEKDIDELHRSGALGSIPSDAVITPSARDRLNELGIQRAKRAGVSAVSTVSASASVGPVDDHGVDESVRANSPKADLDRLFNSPAVHELKEQICDVGRRLWQRAYVDGNGGNLSIRLTQDVVLCTPTLVSKGFMKPEDLCLVDLDGNQLAGVKKRTSEILMHLSIMKAQPKARAVSHAHPPYATGFAVAGVQPPTCMIPEIEVFIGRVPIAPYETPGTPEMGLKVAELVDKHNTVLMENHGVVSWSNTIEDAYFKMEIVEAYCRTVLVTTQLGVQPKQFSPKHLQDLLEIKQKLGVPDPRIGLKECELCDNDEWRPGVTCAVPANAGDSATETDPEAETVVKAVTDEILNRLKG
ncbi:MAG: class II aldolase/adducin family protein [Verrucomicrobiota bacterium]|jgi:L-fuculose-phosphate aldolase|nr:class II aldolase/adducin family protein [Verrucomicrobiota bacterium]MEE2942813.1 class II aldolase/adducin family protein [Verrucomicrobiota bacterium]|tara:strand:+ start:318 stop:1397 length:1080 start_codon:yes stop_codon:yes gene_type:complete